MREAYDGPVGCRVSLQHGVLRAGADLRTNIRMEFDVAQGILCRMQVSSMQVAGVLALYRDHE